MAVWQWRTVAGGLTLVAIGGAMERNQNEENKERKRRDLTLRKQKEKEKELWGSRRGERGERKEL
ncbi:uncharacterized protein G2W53_041991 [Senna tora]|uniref:Uncharacterized protein n=1 Tax=Senna tora TaxID=362788 RepID=A0A834VZL3_9FABA|nr:uncharacterized protein G2W53_041991 [Senna tora]